jgi:hypothetical protein
MKRTPLAAGFARLSSRWAVPRAPAITAAVVVSAALGAQPARAGTYVMRNCDVPGHGYSAMGPWSASAAAYRPTVDVVDRCATGGGVAFTVASQMPAGAVVAAVLLKPTGAQTPIRLVKVAVWSAARLAGSGSPLRFSSAAVSSDGTLQPGVSNNPPGAENVFFEQPLSPTDTSYYELWLKCGPDSISATTDPCVPAVGVPVEIRGMEVTLSEDLPPIVSQPGGTLISGGAQSGTRTLTYAASDPQSGLAKVAVLLDGVVVASRDLTPGCFYSDFTVCPASDEGTLQIDTRTVSNGTHSLKLRVQDAAGNERVVDGGSTIEIANEPAAGSSTAPVYNLTARFRGSSRSTVTVPYGLRVSLRGRLMDNSQPGPADAQIDVLERLGRHGAREVTVANVRTAADGSFSYALPSHRPSRTLRLAYRPGGGSTVFSRSMKLRVRAASTMHATLRGVVVHFSGRVRSGPIPKGGKTVRMQGRAPGSAWKSFASLRTNRKGSFSGTYRLRIRRPGVKLNVRAFVPTEAGYPYVGSRSKAVTLRVR